MALKYFPIKEALDNAVNLTKKPLEDLLNSLVGQPLVNQTDTEVKQDIAEELLTSSLNLIIDSGFDEAEGNINEEYDDIVTTTFEINKLTKLVSTFKSKDYLKEQYAKAKDRLAVVELIHKKALENRNNREIKNVQENKLYASSILSVTGFKLQDDGSFVADESNEFIRHIKNVYGEQKLKALIELANNDSVTAQYVVGQIVSDNAEEFNKSRTQFNKEVKEFFKVFNNPSTGIKNTFKEISEEEVDALLNSPIRVFKHILQEIVTQGDFVHKKPNLGFKGFLSIESSSVSPYSNLDLLKYVPTAEDSHITKETYAQLINIYLKAIAFKQLELASKSERTNINYLTNLLNYLKQQKKLQEEGKPSKPAFSSGQERVIVELASFLSSEAAPKQIHNNIVTMRAPAGAGKSLIITPLGLNLLGFTDSDIQEKVVTAAATEPAAVNIAESLGHSEHNTISQIIDKLNAGTIGEEVEVLIVDEVGIAGIEQLDNLARALVQHAIKNDRPPIKAIYIYDPNQLTSGDIPLIEANGFGFPSNLGRETFNEAGFLIGEYSSGDKLQYAHHLYDLTPLSVTYRSNVSEIVELQNTFKGKTGLPNVLTSTATVNPKLSMKDALGKYVEVNPSNLDVILKNSIRDNGTSRSRMIIVGTQEKVDKYKKQFPDVEVQTV